jgi:hypothetical protein
MCRFNFVGVKSSNYQLPNHQVLIKKALMDRRRLKYISGGIEETFSFSLVFFKGLKRDCCGDKIPLPDRQYKMKPSKGCECAACAQPFEG